MRKTWSWGNSVKGPTGDPEFIMAPIWEVGPFSPERPAARQSLQATSLAIFSSQQLTHCPWASCPFVSGK